MAAGVSTELSKLAARPAVKVLGIVFLLLVVVFGYLLSYLFIVGAGGDPPPQAQGFVNTLLPKQFLSTALTNFTGFGSAIALILGAMAVGSEYGWDTFKAILVQGSGKLELFGGKLVALAAVLVVFTLVMLGAGAATSYVMARLLEEQASWPGIWEIVRAAGAGWLILAVFCALGVALATVFRGTALAVGLGLVYLLLLSNIVNGLAVQSDTAANVAKTLPVRNSLDLGRAFGDLSGQAQAAAAGTQPVGATQAALVLGAYLLGFLVIAVALFKVRDVA